MLDTLLRMVKLKIYGKRFIIPFLLIFLVLAIVFCNLLPLENKSLVAIELETDSNSIFQIFWAGKDSNGSIQQYTEKQSFPFHIYQNKNNYHFLIPDLTSILRLRIDPLKEPSKITIKRISITQMGYKPIILDTVADFKRLAPLRDIKDMHNTRDGLVIRSSGIDPQLEFYVDPQKAYFVYVIGIMASFIIVFSIPIFFHYIAKLVRISFSSYKNFINDFCNKTALIVWGVLSAFTGAFLLFVIPVSIPPDYRLFYYIIYSIGIGLIIFLIGFLLIIRPFHKNVTHRVNRVSWVVYALPCFIIWSICLLAFWPASMSPDSLNQWGEAISGHFSDHHPAFHTMNIWLITHLWCSPSAVVFAQIFALGSVAGWGLSIIKKLGVSKVIIWISSFLFAFSLVNNLMVVTLWKDVAYSIAVLALTLVVLRIIMTNGFWLTNRRSLLIFSFLIVLTALYRHNGIIAAFGTPIILLFFFRQYWRQITLVFVFALILFWGIRGPLYEALDVKRSKPSPRITVKFPKSVGEDRALVKKAKSALSEKNSSSFIERGLEILKYYTYSSSQIWRIRPLRGFFKRVEYANIWRDPHGKLRYVNSNKMGIKESSIFPGLSAFLYRQLTQSWHSDFFFLLWRPAFYIYVFIACVTVASIRLKSWKLMLISVPIVLHSLPFLVIQLTKTVFRYHYPVAVVSLLLCIPVLFIDKIVMPSGKGHLGEH